MAWQQYSAPHPETETESRESRVWRVVASAERLRNNQEGEGESKSPIESRVRSREAEVEVEVVNGQPSEAIAQYRRIQNEKPAPARREVVI
jgi:hypothetical protein